MEISRSLIVIAVAWGILQLAAGFLLGRWWTPRGTSGSLSARELQRLARKMFGLVDGVADDVSQHQLHIQHLSDELQSLPPADPGALAGFLVSTVQRILKINEQLQSRLLHSEDRLQQQNEQLRSHITAALTDPLTKLYNRRACDDELARRLSLWQRKGTPFCLLMIDVDHFKAVNDRYGHALGDQVLQHLAGVFRCVLGETELIARIGGEEFVALLPRIGLPEASRIAQRVLVAVATTSLQSGPPELRPTVSLGLAAVAPGDRPTALMTRADEALYVAKHHGRNCGYYHDGQGYRRIDAIASTPAVPLADPVQSELELQAACSDLRSRLAEILGDGPESSPSPSTDRRSGGRRPG
jgi:diguanylate cyclase (GGDEF)-like protein